ncbi:MAG: exosome complex protein Rrp4 [Aigarchaeota archaeon]|nr:exosome complex protein Rrp4 [Candidatus Pelearchaeum maunauluense]
MYYFNEKEIVVPGQLLADDPKKSGPGTYVLDGKVYAAHAGLPKLRDGVVVVIPLKGPYKPEAGDWIVGVVTDVKPSSIEVDLGGYMTAVLKYPERQGPPEGLTVGDVIYARVKSSNIRGVFLESEEMKKLTNGIIISMTPARIPRLIGRKGSMIALLKKETGCNFWVGRNGLIVVSGKSSEGESAAISAIRVVEKEAHSQGLTDRVAALLKSAKGRNHDDREQGDKAN